jgi:hypothetical protein
MQISEAIFSDRLTISFGEFTLQLNSATAAAWA